MLSLLVLLSLSLLSLSLLLPLLVLLSLGLLLPFVLLSLGLLSLLVLLSLGLLSLLVLLSLSLLSLSLLLPLLVLLSLGLLPLLVLLSLGLLSLLVLLSLSLLLLTSLLLLLFRLGLLLAFLLCGLGFLLLFRGFVVWLALPCVRRRDGSKKKEQNSRADKSDWFHDCCLHYRNFRRYSLVAFSAIDCVWCVPSGRDDRSLRQSFIHVQLSPHAHVGERMKESKNVQKPQHYADHHNCIQNGLDRSLHWYVAVDQPKQDTYHDQNHQYLKNRHFSISLLFAGRHSGRLQGVTRNFCLDQKRLVPDGMRGSLRSPLLFRRKLSDLFSPWSSCFSHTPAS